jgi:hypothetical protein
MFNELCAGPVGWKENLFCLEFFDVVMKKSSYKNDIRLRPAAKKGFDLGHSEISQPKSKKYS